MSALLRALIGQQVGESDNNLAVIKSATAEFSGTPQQAAIEKVGVTAKVEKGKKYRVRFDFQIIITRNNNNQAIVQLGSPTFWNAYNTFYYYKMLGNQPGVSGSVDVTATCFKTDTVGTDIEFLYSRVGGNRGGNITVTNLIVEEVK